MSKITLKNKETGSRITFDTESKRKSARAAIQKFFEQTELDRKDFVEVRNKKKEDEVK